MKSIWAILIFFEATEGKKHQGVSPDIRHLKLIPRDPTGGLNKKITQKSESSSRWAGSQGLWH